METTTYLTKGGIEVTRRIRYTDKNEIPEIVNSLDTHRGAVYSSNYEYPGRYSRWEIGFCDPGIELRDYKEYFLIQALSGHGMVLYRGVKEAVCGLECVELIEEDESYFKARILPSGRIFPEEMRSKQNSIFSVLRAIHHLLYSAEDSTLGLYGAFGYDLIFQFEKEIPLSKPRNPKQEELVLYLPDTLFINDKKKEEMFFVEYDFKYGKMDSTLADRAPRERNTALPEKDISGENLPQGGYADLVRKAVESFRRGDLFEVVPSHVLNQKTDLSPHEIYNRMIQINPSPYNFFINLGRECLIGSSPEMYVRVEGRMVETCPISGTIRRGKDPLEDARNIRTLLNSAKDEAELTMCTDVDRNDKSRVCVPGSVRVCGRRQIEKYSHLIHTVDHIQGTLQEGYDLFDAFLTHMWAVTITGAPKRAAAEWIEQMEPTPRDWYGGAVGYMKFNGDMNTGLTLRTVRTCNNDAQIRVGATLLIDSVPEDEEAETMTKAAALLESIASDKPSAFPLAAVGRKSNPQCLCGKKVLIVDHEDSFVHTLANYIRALGGDVSVIRYQHLDRFVGAYHPDVVLLSPGPGLPERFDLKGSIALCESLGIPILGICLGLQGIVEYYGGTLGILEHPRHGAAKKVFFKEGFFDDGARTAHVGLYHSIYASHVPENLEIIAKDEDGVVMGVTHRSQPVVGLQFHPESILSQEDGLGMEILARMFQLLGVTSTSPV